MAFRSLFNLMRRKKEHDGALERFVDMMGQKAEPSVLEIGARRVDSQESTIHRNFVPHAKEYIGTDFQDGLDVDVVADVHDLSNVFGENRFDGIISCSTFEHIKYPWIAAVEISRTLKTGGLAYIHSVHTFPIHGFPYDYYRYSVHGLKTLFGEQVGFEVIEANYNYRAMILTAAMPKLYRHRCHLNSVITVRKIAHPPDGFVWRYDK